MAFTSSYTIDSLVALVNIEVIIGCLLPEIWELYGILIMNFIRSIHDIFFLRIMKLILPHWDYSFLETWRCLDILDWITLYYIKSRFAMSHCFEIRQRQRLLLHPLEFINLILEISSHHLFLSFLFSSKRRLLFGTTTRRSLLTVLISMITLMLFTIKCSESTIMQTLLDWTERFWFIITKRVLQSDRVLHIIRIDIDRWQGIVRWVRLLLWAGSLKVTYSNPMTCSHWTYLLSMLTGSSE